MSLSVIHSFPVWLPQTQTWLYQQVRFLPDTITSHIVCKETEHLDQFHLPNIHALSGASSRMSRLSTRLLRHLDYHMYVRLMCRRLAPDIVHSHFGPVGWKNHLVMQLPASSRIRKIKRVVTFYGQDVDYLPRVNPAWNKRYRDMFGHIDMVLCEGPFMAGKVKALGCPADRIRVHHLGVDLDSISFQQRKKQKDEPFRVLMAAALRPKKGFIYGLRALEQVASRYDLEVTLVGDATGDAESIREKERIIQFLKTSPLSNKVKMTGFMSAGQLMETAGKHHIYLAPSVTADAGDSEGGAPISLIEMAASGMPVISSHHCDIPGVIKNGVSGYLAEERDTEGIAKCLQKLMAHPESWTDMTINARKHIENHFDARKQGIALSKLYEMI